MFVGKHSRKQLQALGRAFRETGREKRRPGVGSGTRAPTLASSTRDPGTCPAPQPQVPQACRVCTSQVWWAWLRVLPGGEPNSPRGTQRGLSQGVPAQGHQVEAGSEQEQTQGHPRHDTCQSSARLAMQTAAAPNPPQGSRDHSLGRGMARSSHSHLHPGLQLPRSSKGPTNLHKLPTAPCPVCRPEQTGFWSLGGGS